MEISRDGKGPLSAWRDWLTLPHFHYCFLVVIVYEGQAGREAPDSRPAGHDDRDARAWGSVKRREAGSGPVHNNMIFPPFLSLISASIKPRLLFKSRAPDSLCKKEIPKIIYSSSSCSTPFWAGTLNAGNQNGRRVQLYLYTPSASKNIKLAIISM